jgi:hypothetical protein
LYSEYPLATRKWALQERFLSQRIIHLTASELVWECQIHTSCECRILDDLHTGYSTYQKVREALRRSSEDRHELIYEWMKLLESYSRGELTRETDALPAIAGLASKFYYKNLGEYFAGLWVEEVPMTLCWFSRPLAEGVTDNERPSTYVAPTWSWASVQGPLCFDAWDDFGTYSIARAKRKESVCEGRGVRIWRDESRFQFPLSRCADDSDLDTSDGDGLEIVASVVSISLSPDPLDSTEFGRVKHGILSMSTFTCVVAPHSVSENSILGFEGGEFMPDTLDDIPFAEECVIALIFVRTCEWSGSDDDDGLMSDGDSDAPPYSWKGQALVLVDTEGEEEDEGGDEIHINGNERRFRRCGLLRVPEKSLSLFGEEEVVLHIV